MEFSYILTVQVAPQDADLAGKVGKIVKDRFDGTAIRVIECEPFRPGDTEVASTVAVNLIWQAGYDAAIRKIAEG